jgi:hypothetical protein
VAPLVKDFNWTRQFQKRDFHLISDLPPPYTRGTLGAIEELF